MAIEFPNSPVEGDQFTASNGVIYTYENGGWNGNSASGLEDVFVNISGDEMTGNLTVPSLNGGQLAGFRNQLINGDFRVWQRGANITANGNNYTVDRWRANGGVTGNVSRASVNFSGNSFAVEATYTGVATGGLSQLIELPEAQTIGPFYGTWTCSWWANSSNFAPLLRFNDNFITGAWTSAGTFSAPKIIETVDVWNRYSATISFTAGPAAKDIFLALTMENQTAETVSFTGVQLEPGPVATPFEHRPIQTELALCKRYYNFFEGRTFYGMPMARLNDRCCSQIFWPEMRIAPTVTFEGVWKWRETGKGSPNITNTPALSGYGSKLTGAAICTDVTTINHGNWLEHGKLILDAEL